MNSIAASEGDLTREELFQATVSSTNPNLLVVAPPGCGKTELLARRALFLIDSLEPRQRILALTFSNKAKANLGARLREVLGPERMRRYVSVRNFHGHAAEVIRAHGRTLGLDSAFERPTRSTLSSAIASYVEGLSVRDAGTVRDRIETNLRIPKQRPYTDRQVVDWLAERAEDAELQIELSRQASGQLHYDDLLRHAQRLLRVDEVAHLYREHYAAILVDEFQDLSPQQLDIAMRSSGQARTFVGDPLQGIYSWAGARPIQVERQLRRICGDPEGLGVSYRSSPRVLALLNTVAAELGGHALESDEPERWFDGGVTAGFSSATGESEAETVVSLCRAILEQQPDATIGIISRMGWRRALVDAAFVDADLPHVRWDLAISEPRIAEQLREAAARLGFSDLNVDSLRDEMVRDVDAADVETRSEIEEALSQLSDSAASAGSLEAALRQLAEPELDDRPIPAGVHLLNAHVGKGQQFDWVFIPGLEKGHIPSFLAGNRAAELLEEQRILLVMLSRARHGVIVSRAKSLTSRAGNRYSPDPSPWVKLLVGNLSSNLEGLRAHIAALPPRQPHPED